MNWAFSGVRPFDVEISLDYLIENSYLNKGRYGEVMQILGMTDQELQNNYNVVMSNVLSLLEKLEEILTTHA